MNLDLSKTSGPDCIPVVFLKNCEPELSYMLAELFNKFLKESCFPDCQKVSFEAPVFKNAGKGLQLKTTTLLVFFLWLVRSLKIFHIIELLITQRNAAFFLISSVVLDLLDQLQVFVKLYLIEFRGLLTSLELLELQHLTYPRLSTEFGMLVFFTNQCLIEFHIRYLAVFLLFSVIDGFEFWMGSLHKNILLMLEFLKAPLLVLHFSYCILMTFLMMLSVILLSVLMIVLSILSVIRHLICDKNLNWLLNLTLI